ncbi:MAG: hypothetical protein INR71_08265, partial [Terriglobus roseus]|nr:hypothetical protein [Terriglobus roseus]
MAGATVDAPYLAATYGVPEPTFQALVESPTVELVRTLLAQLEEKAREFDAVAAEKLRADVQLENAVRAGEAKARALKASQDK